MAFLHFLPFSMVFLATITNIFLFTNVDAFSEGTHLCTQTSYPALCNSILKLHPTNNATAATKTAIYVTILQTQHAMSTANKLIHSRRATGRSDLKVCKTVYDDALRNLRLSMKNLKSNSRADLNINLSAALADFVTCDDGFTEKPGRKSPLAKVNKLLQKLAINCLALVSEMKH